ncbi:hypothetical protein LBBP_03351 [Leptospira borgpetersenii serovar Ballum]|uniref:Uncharacterized protein n=1 Tax=Leptospira borgpetersenii serovar Ballum TaxID=280505 RepID=A0A0S2IV99_LEPBO|nr:hypothetical protein LBBP_03351 [Leptospira borgpetersenii serovar Ballum]
MATSSTKDSMMFEYSKFLNHSKNKKPQSPDPGNGQEAAVHPV